MNKKIPTYLLGKYQLLGTVTFSVLFALIFLNIYIPFSDTAWFDMRDATLFSRTLSFGATTIMTLIISRMLMYRSKNYFDMTYFMYITWCLMEIITISAFYTWITIEITAASYDDVWDIFSRSLLYGGIALGIPYLISSMYFAIIDKNNTIRLMNYDNIVTDEPLKSKSTQKITLFDNSGILKLSISPENLYYIESDDNYIKVWYTDSKGELTKYMMRCRLKTVEDNFKESGLIRCNRKYIVNINKVSLLHKENDGYILDLCNSQIPPLPITKTYLDAVLGHFTEQQPLMDPID